MSSHSINFNKNLNNSLLKNKFDKNYKKLINQVISKLENSNGFVVLKNIDIKNLSLNKTIKIYSNLMKKLGVLLVQNKKKEKIVKVQNLGKQWTANNRGYKTNENINFHTDGGTYAGLMCVSEPHSGGENMIVSSKKIYDLIKKKNPKYLKTLREGFFYHTRGENKGSEKVTKKKYPMFTFKNNLLHCMFNKNPILWAYEKITLPSKKKKEIFKVLNSVETISNKKENITTLKLKQGDILIVNNYKVLHARKKFKDRNKKKRLLLRAWVKAKNTQYSGPTLLDVYNNK